MSGVRLSLHATLRALLLTAFTLITSIQVAHADEHEDWELHLGGPPGPLAGHCGRDLHARGINFSPESQIVVGRINDAGAFEELQRVTSQGGWFSEVLIAPYPPDCGPGDTVVISVRALDATGSDSLALQDQCSRYCGS